MKISFDISAMSSSSSSLSSTATTSVREWIISHTRSLLPSLPASLYDFVPFTLAAIMALLFTALLVLLVEDSDDLGPHPNESRSRQPGDRPAISHKSNHRSSQRLVGLAERDKDAECGDDDEWEPSPWDPNADIDPNLNLKQSQNWMAIQNAKIATSHGYRTTNKRLLASPNSSASPQSPAPTPPMLSMAKLIMHRHDQLSKRARSSKAASLPPSPPPTGSTSFGSMQYTLKSATIKSEKLALVAFPAAEPEPSSSPLHHDTEKGTQGRPHPSSNTRHARTRSVALPSISLPSISSLLPALQLLQSKPSQDQTVRRSPSSLLEEGGSSTHSRKASPESLASISESFEATNSSERRVSESLVELEKGHTSSR